MINAGRIIPSDTAKENFTDVIVVKTTTMETIPV
jgi:hypothetical protein